MHAVKEPAELSRIAQAQRRLRGALAVRLSPEHTRQATRFEQLTVQRLSWNHVVRLNRYLEMFGKLTNCLWVGFLATIVLGVEWRGVVERAINSGRPVEGTIVLLIVVPTLAFVAARSGIGFARWRLQRELWRRDVQRLKGDHAGDRAATGHPMPPSASAAAAPPRGGRS